MANIAVINYCNLKCPYCFANEFIEENKQVITMEQLDTILNWLKNGPVGRVGLIGGEPTLHPEFSNILTKTIDFSEKKKSRVCLFSNGILLGDYARLFTDRVNVLINLNHPDIVGSSNWNQIEMSIKRFEALGKHERMNIGINLYPDMLGYDYIIDTAKKFKFDSIRCSYVAPTCNYIGVDKKDYYTKAKPTFISFVEDCTRNNIKVRLDCNNIPKCYFTDEELSLLHDVEGWKTLCNPVVDITPDMHGTACFGAYDLIDLTQFESLADAENYLLFKKVYPLRLLNSGGDCATCKKFENLSCQGGCLAFTKK